MIKRDFGGSFLVFALALISFSKKILRFCLLAMLWRSRATTATDFRAYGFWGFQHSLAAQLDPNTMYSVRPGTEVIPYFIPASKWYGEVRDPAGTHYPALYKEQKLTDFNFFEASSIRKVGNKYVIIFSGYSGPDYGLGSTIL